MLPPLKHSRHYCHRFDWLSATKDCEKNGWLCIDKKMLVWLTPLIIELFIAKTKVAENINRDLIINGVWSIKKSGYS